MEKAGCRQTAHFLSACCIASPIHRLSHRVSQTEEPTTQNPYDRVAFIRPFWESLSLDERVALLTVTLSDVRERAKQHAEKAKTLGERHDIRPRLCRRSVK